MKRETFIVRGQEDLAPCIGWIREFLDKAPLEVCVSTGAIKRSIKQNSLYFLWVTQIANHMGLLKDEVHIMLKRRFAVPIFTRDDEDYAKMIAAVKEVRKQGNEEAYEAMAKKITELTSTTNFKVGTMTEYLNDIEHYAAEIGANLTFPDDLIGYR
jgi:hypothetical protein